MANWSNLKTAISNVVKSNGIQGITGDSLQSVMLNMVTKLGENYMFAGVATPATTPGTPDGNVFYITTQAGTYANFNNTVVADGELAILMWNGAWTKQSMAIATQAKMEEIDQHVTEVDAKLNEMQKGMEDVYAYGVEWDSTVADPTLTRIGNLTLHKSLPIQSQLKGCVANGGVINYYLHPDDWSKKEDGTPSVLDGTDGTVRVKVPRFWGKSGVAGTKRWVKISTVCIDDTWTEIPAMLIDAYRSTTDNTVTATPKLVSVVNTTAAFRGGGNRTAYDTYLETDPVRTDLGKPRTAMTRAVARTWATNAGSELLNYEYYKWIMFWLPVIEYATFNMQANFNSDLTSEGFHQGGLSAGVTNMSNWEFYNGNYSVCPCGYANELGNFTGAKVIPQADWVYESTGLTNMASYSRDTAQADMTAETNKVTITNVKGTNRYMYRTWGYQNGETVYTISGLAEGQDVIFYVGGTTVATATADGDITVNWPTNNLGDRCIKSSFTGSCNIVISIKSASNVNVTVSRPAMSIARYRGFENIFGDLWTNMEGIIIQGYTDEGTSTYNWKNVYTTTNPENYGETETQKAKMKLISSREIHADGYTKDFDLQTTGEIVPCAVGGGSTTYMCDYHYTGNKDASLRTLLLGGSAGCFASGFGVGFSGTDVGFRTLNKIEK
jgi:hypothetical protein